MMRRTSRVAVYLCLLVALNEFGPAHFKRLYHGNRKHLKLQKQTEMHVSGGQKRGLGTFGSYVVKSLVFGSQFLEKATTIAAMITTFYNLVRQCCGDTQTCEYNDESKEIQAELEGKKEEVRKILLETKELESMIEMAQTEFNYTVMEMNKIGKASGRLLYSMDSNISLALQLADNRLENLVAEKQALGQQVEFVKIETEYFNVLDGVLGIAVPLFTSIIPSIPKLKLWIKARMGRYKSYELDHSLDGDTIKPPSRSSSRYQAGHSWFGKQARRIVIKIDDIKFNLKTKYDNALSVAKNIKKGVAVALSFIQSAFNIYLVYKTFTTCSDAETKAKKARDDLRSARTKMNQIYEEVLEAKSNMTEARDSLNEQLTSDILLTDLTELKETLQKLTNDGTDEDFKGIIESIDRYVNGIKNQDATFVESANLIKDLYEGLGQLSTYFICYSDKANVVKKVLEDCQEGENTFDNIKVDAFDFFEKDASMCEQKIGIAPFSDEKLQDVIEERSEKLNFNKICEVNDERNVIRTCEKYCSGTEQAELPKQTRLSEAAVAEIMKLDRCTKCEITGTLKRLVCRSRGRGNSAQDIFDDYLADLDRGYTVKQVEDLDCSEYA